MINPNYIKDVFFIIKAKNKFLELEPFLVYFENTFFNIFDIEFWNYINQYRLRTNNPCEDFNNKLNSYFDKKPTFYNLINILAREEKKKKKETENTIINGLKILCRIGPSEYYELVQYFIEKENDIKGKTLKSKKEKINLWYNASLRLPLN